MVRCCWRASRCDARLMTRVRTPSSSTGDSSTPASTRSSSRSAVTTAAWPFRYCTSASPRSSRLGCCAARRRRASVAYNSPTYFSRSESHGSMDTSWRDFFSPARQTCRPGYIFYLPFLFFCKIEQSCLRIYCTDFHDFFLHQMEGICVNAVNPLFAAELSMSWVNPWVELGWIGSRCFFLLFLVVGLGRGVGPKCQSPKVTFRLSPHSYQN